MGANDFGAHLRFDGVDTTRNSARVGSQSRTRTFTLGAKMATKNLNQLTTTASAASGDLVAIWRVGDGDTRAITKANFMGGVLTGGGTIATGGFTLTVAAASTINGSLVGNMTGGGTVATGGNTLTVGGTSSITGTLSGAGTVATGGFTLTVPATGTASLLGTAQTFSALKTFTAGLTFGEDTLSKYDVGVWTPVVADAASGGNTATVSVANGWYVAIGDLVIAGANLTNITTTGMTSGNKVYIRGLPFATSNVANRQSNFTASVGNVTFSGYVTALLRENVSYVELVENISANARTSITVGDLTSTTADIYFIVAYIKA